jgi:pimeloyl-ACP methyl ester carboxylesterase
MATHPPRSARRRSLPFRLPEATPYLRAGSGEPLLLLHPFTLSHDVWHDVVPLLSDDYDVAAMTLPGHWGAPKLRRRDMCIRGYADAIEAFLDELGWQTCHVAGNSIGGWLGLELARRGRVRTLTAIAPAGGWTRLSVAQLLAGFKFLLLAPLALLGWLTGDVGRHIASIRNLAIKVAVHDPRKVPRERADNFIRASSHCPSYMPFLNYLWADLRDGGIRDLQEISVPTQLVFCDKDWLLPEPRYGRMFREGLLDAPVVTLPDVGHVPMLENPNLVAETIRTHLERTSPDAA